MFFNIIAFSLCFWWLCKSVDIDCKVFFQCVAEFLAGSMLQGIADFHMGRRGFVFVWVIVNVGINLFKGVRKDISEFIGHLVAADFEQFAVEVEFFGQSV